MIVIQGFIDIDLYLRSVITHVCMKSYDCMWRIYNSNRSKYGCEVIDIQVEQMLDGHEQPYGWLIRLYFGLVTDIELSYRSNS